MENRVCFGNVGWAFSPIVFLLAACSTTSPVKYYTLNTLPEMQHKNPDTDGAVGYSSHSEMIKVLKRRCSQVDIHFWMAPSKKRVTLAEVERLRTVLMAVSDRGT